MHVGLLIEQKRDHEASAEDDATSKTPVVNDKGLLNNVGVARTRALTTPHRRRQGAARQAHTGSSSTHRRTGTYTETQQARATTPHRHVGQNAVPTTTGDPDIRPQDRHRVRNEAPLPCVVNAPTTLSMCPSVKRRARSGAVAATTSAQTPHRPPPSEQMASIQAG